MQWRASAVQKVGGKELIARRMERCDSQYCARVCGYQHVRYCPSVWQGKASDHGPRTWQYCARAWGAPAVLEAAGEQHITYRSTIP
eukprot:3207520-Rhodomonas_salina.1